MCGVIDDAFNFVKDSVGEVFSHPGEAAGALFGVPGYDPFFGGLFNPNHSLLSPTGNFTSSAWNDMYNANPQDSGALGLFSGINSIADKVAPAAAGYFAAPAMAGALGGSGSDAANIGADTFTSGLGAGGTGVSTLGGLESGMGGAAMFGPTAGTGTAIGSGVAQGLGAGGLGVAGGESLAGLTASGGTYAGGLGGSTSSGTGLGSLTNGGASLSGISGSPTSAAAPIVDLGGSGTSMEGAQAALSQGAGNPAIASGATGGADTAGGNLSTMYGPESTAAASPTGGALGQSTQGVSTMGTGADIPGQSIGANYSAAANGMDQGGGGFLQSLANLWGQSGLQGNDLMNLAKMGQSFWQQHQAAQNARNYAGSISSLFGPNSPYAQQMQQTLARQDAAAGRNSQYGTRATQLAAALTQAQAQALGGNNYAQAAQNNSGTQVLNGLFNAFGNPSGMQSAGRLGTAAFNGLQSLFG